MFGNIILSIFDRVFYAFIIIIMIVIPIQFHSAIDLNNALYLHGNIISTTGVFTTENYYALRDRIEKTGDYGIEIRLDSLVSKGVYDIYFDKEDILDSPLDKGDKLSIQIISSEISAIDKVMYGFDFAKNPPLKPYETIEFVQIFITKDGEWEDDRKSF